MAADGSTSACIWAKRAPASPGPALPRPARARRNERPGKGGARIAAPERMSMSVSQIPHPRVSVVVPVRNEAGNIGPLVAEIEAACAGLSPFEVVFVNDGSSDGTEAALRE